MKKTLLKQLRDFFPAAKKNFNLRKVKPTESSIQLLKDLYPAVNWNRVDFYEGLPWFTPVVAPYVTAQALPNFYSLDRFKIYLLKFDETRAQCLSDLVHEAYHIMQAMQFGKGYGFGFFRGFLFYYIALFFKYGYRQNPFEIPAYDQEFMFLRYCQQHGIHGMVPRIDPRSVAAIGKEEELKHTGWKFRYQDSPLLLVGSFFLCLLITVARPFADLLVVIVGLFLPGKKKLEKKDLGGPRSG